MTAADFRAAREELGISQAELGRRLGVTQGAVSRWEADGSGTRPSAIPYLVAQAVRQILARHRRRVGSPA